MGRTWLQTVFVGQQLLVLYEHRGWVTALYEVGDLYSAQSGHRKWWLLLGSHRLRLSAT